MKNILLILLTGLFMGCSSGSSEKEKSDIPAKETEANDHGEGETKHSGLSLNNGSKWKLDDATRVNISGLRDILKDSTNKNYPKIAGALREQSNKLIKECRMQGPDHDALHTWLEKFLTGLGKFEKGTTEEQAETVTYLKQDLEDFNTYFE